MASKSKFFIPETVKFTEAGDVLCVVQETCLESRGKNLKVKTVSPLTDEEEVPALVWDNKPTVGFELVGSRKSDLYLKLPGTGYAYALSTSEMIRLAKQGDISTLALQLILRKSGNEWVWASEAELANSEVNSYRDSEANKGASLLGLLKLGDAIEDNNSADSSVAYIVGETDTYYELARYRRLDWLRKTGPKLRCIDVAKNRTPLSNRALDIYARAKIVSTLRPEESTSLLGEVLSTLNTLRDLSAEDLTSLVGVYIPGFEHRTDLLTDVAPFFKSLLAENSLSWEETTWYSSSPSTNPWVTVGLKVAPLKKSSNTLCITLNIKIEAVAQIQGANRGSREFKRDEGSISFSSVEEAILFVEGLIAKR